MAFCVYCSSSDKIVDIFEPGLQWEDRLMCLFWSVKKEQYLLYSATDGIWSQVGHSGRSDHSIVIWENDGDIVVLEDRRGLSAPGHESTATVVQWLAPSFFLFKLNIPEAIRQ